MKSGLEGRNNDSTGPVSTFSDVLVSMKSGLEGRNNGVYKVTRTITFLQDVSMKSGLEGRNNKGEKIAKRVRKSCLNEVRPRRPEQYLWLCAEEEYVELVSMKSGLEGRNNLSY